MRLLTLLAALGAAVPAFADDKEDLAKAAAKAAALDSYAFKLEINVEAQAFQLPQQIPALEGKYQKDVGLHLTLGGQGEMFRQGSKIFVKQGDGEWMDLESAGGGGGKGGGRRGMGLRMLTNVKGPHEELKDFEKTLKEVKRAEGSDKVGDRECSIYSGDQTDEAAKQSPIGQTLARFGAQAEMKGKAKAWVDRDGAIVKYEIRTDITTEFQGNAIELTMTRTTVISDAGKVKVEVPEALRKLLGEKSEDKKPEEKTPEEKKN